MSSAMLFMCIIVIMILSIEYYINRRVINIPSVLSFPYLVIILLNNLIMYRLGFDKISESVIYMISMGLFFFFLGSLIVDFGKRVSRTGNIREYEQNKNKLHYYKIGSMCKYTAFVEIIVITRLLLIISSHGLSYLSSTAFEGVLITGVLGHLFLTIYATIPIIFYYWLNDKRKLHYLLLYLIGILLLFLTFVKYHVIGAIVLTFLFVCLEDKTYLRKGSILLILATVLLFVGNYLLGFALHGTVRIVNNMYYIRHLWGYIAGSLIYDNEIFTTGVRVGTSIFYKLGSFVFTPINVFLNAFLGYRITPHVGQPFILLGSNGERGNVVDALGYLYPSKEGWVEIAFYYLVILVFGMMFTHIYNQAIKKKNKLSTPVCVFMTFFIFFSFFGTFYVNLPPWEVLFWCVFMLCLFDKRIVVTFRGKRI